MRDARFPEEKEGMTVGDLQALGLDPVDSVGCWLLPVAGAAAGATDTAAGTTGAADAVAGAETL